MSAQRFTEWQLYEAVEPFGERAHYWRTGQLCAAIQNSQRAKRSDPVARAEDFMPKTFTDNDDDADEPSARDDFAQLQAQQARLTKRSV